MRRFIAIASSLVLFVAVLPVASVSAAITPTLSLSSTGGGLVDVSVSADSNATVMFYYNVGSSSGMQTLTLGTTNSSGYFSTTIQGSSDNINPGQSVYVVVDGAQSAMESWPAPTGTPTLNQTSVTVGLGQSVSVYSSGSSAGVYVSENSNPSVASVQTNGAQITVAGEEIGSTNLSVCYTGTADDCANLAVIVQTGSVLTFSENNLDLGIGQDTSITVSGGSGSYSITGNSNSSVTSVSLNGNSITLSPYESGTATISVCDTSGNCGTLEVTVGSSGASGGSVVFGVSNPTLTVGQSLDVSLSGGSNYYISSNTNGNIVQATVSGSSLNLYAENAGSDSLTVCASSGGCNAIAINVTGSTVSTVTTSNASLLSTIQSMQSELAQIVTQIQSMTTTLNQLAVSAGATAPTVSDSTTSGLYDFTQFLSVGSEGADVTALQQYLTKKGFYSGPITGYFGSETETAVESYQSAHGINAVGYVGPGTRSALNAGE